MNPINCTKTSIRITLTVLIISFLFIFSETSLSTENKNIEKYPENTTLTLLGTMGGPPLDVNLKRAEPAMLLEVHGKKYLVDAGVGSVRNLMEVGVPPYKVKTVFISHNHLDHTAALVPFMAESWFMGWMYDDKDYVSDDNTPFVHIYGPPDTKELFKGAMKFIDVSADVFNNDDTGGGTMKLPDEVFAVHAINPEDGVFYDRNGLKVIVVENTHYDSKDGSLSSELKKNGHRSYAYRFDTPEGSIVYTGDTGPSKAVTKLAKNADVLVTEVLNFELFKKSMVGDALTSDENDLEKLKHHMQKQHLSPEAVGKMAHEANVDTVILTHVVPGDAPMKDYPKFEAGVRKYFSGTIIMGQDLFQYTIF